MKKRIIHYTQANTSGAALYVSCLVQSMGRQYHDIELICPPDFAYKREVAKSGAAVKSVEAPPVGGGKAFTLWSYFRQTLAGFRLIARDKRSIALVHLNFPGLPIFAVFLLLGLRGIGLITILTVHDVTPHRWLLPKKLRSMERWVLTWMYRLPTHLCVHHASAGRQLSDSFGIDPAKTLIIPHGTYRMVDHPLPFPAGTPVTALVFGTIRENKGIHLGIEAVQELRRAGREVRLVIAGRPYASEADYWRSCVEKIARQPEGIEVIDRFVDDKEIVEIMRNVHLLLLPYTDFNSQSGVAVLGLSNGRPLVATDVGGISEILRHGQTGLVINEASVRFVREALDSALDLGVERLEEMGVCGFEFVNQELGWDNIASRYLRWYRELWNCGKPAHGSEVR
jgi:glycogen synthase